MRVKSSILAFALTLFTVPLFAAPTVAIRTEVSPREIYIGDPIDYRLFVTISSEVMVAPLLPPVTMGDFELIQASSPTVSYEKDGKSTTLYRFFVTTYSTGSLSIPPLSLQFSTMGGAFSESKTEEVRIKVKSLLEEKGDEGNLRPLKGLFNFKSYLWIWILLGILVTGGLGYLFWRWWSKKTGRAGPEVTGPPRPAEEVAWEAIHQLEDADLIATGHIKEFYYQLSNILRAYLERRFGFSALDRTSTELMAEFRRQNFQLILTGLCRDFFENADLAKFAKLTPTPDEVTNDLNKVKQFINLTIPVKESTEPKEKIPV